MAKKICESEDVQREESERDHKEDSPQEMTDIRLEQGHLNSPQRQEGGQLFQSLEQWGKNQHHNRPFLHWGHPQQGNKIFVNIN